VTALVESAQWFFLAYFVLLNGGYLLLNLLALANIRHHLRARTLDALRGTFSGMEPPVSLLVPAYNEQATIAAAVRSMLQLEYPEFEVIVVNDGSRDGTLETLRREFDLRSFPEAYWRRIPVAAVRGIYRSEAHPNLKVIDKANGGKADALNAGINAARYPLVCGVDADSILERNSLARVVTPFLEDPTTIAAGGIVRVANGCEVRGGFLERVALPRRLLPLLQVIEYLRAFLFGRLGWTPLNAVLIISGAFGIFRKEAVIEAGGYRTDTVGEDMELVTRLHRTYRAARRPYRIEFVPDPICWTEAPESLTVLKRQRQRWQQGLGESLRLNWRLPLSRHGGAPGWIAFPFMLLFEWLAPAVEVAAYAFMGASFALGIVSWQAFVAFLTLALGTGILLSVLALLLEELSFHVYTKRGDLPRLALAAVLENFGYRQLLALWRFAALARSFGGRAKHWGEMKRSAHWQRAA
jgi:cellulose synthase/poly-beta-1,6-N-acetylglucosamine synthase-like glycosyltransferase